MAKLVLDFEKSDGTKMQITDDDIVSVSSLSQSASDTSTINYGSIASTGSIDIQDKWNKLEDMVLDGDIPASNANIDLIINNNVLQSHISSDSSFDNSSNELNITLTNKIDEWDTLKYKGYIYPNESRTLYQILEDVLINLGYTQSQIKHSTSSQIVYTGVDSNGNKTTNVGPVSEYLENIRVEYPSIEYGKTYRQIINEICVVAQLRCFIDDENNLKFISGRPLVSELDTPIEIPLSVVLDDITGDLFIKNKYDGVEIDETSVNDNVDIETVLYTWKDKDEKFDSNTTSDSDEKTTSSLGISIYSYVKVTATYYTGTIKLKKKSGDNLEQVLSVLDGVDSNGNPRIKYNVNYTHNTGGVNVVSTGEQFFIIPNYTSSYEGSGSLATYSSISTSVGSTISASVNDETNLKIIKFTSDDDYYYATFKVLVGYTKINGSYTQTPYQLSGSSESFEPKSVEVSVYGNKRTITFNNSSASTENISEAKTVANIQSSSLLQDKTTFDGKIKMSEIIKHNILSDYENGTRSLSFRTVCSDLYDSEGNKVVDFKNGEVVQNGNLIYLNGDNSKIYTIYSRDFIYDGSPEVELMAELNKILYYYGLYKNGSMVSGWDELLKTGKITTSRETLTGKLVITGESIESGDGDKLIVKNNVKTISSSSFQDSILSEIVLPDSVTSIGSYAFSGSNISKIKLPNKITSIIGGTFNNCKNLSEINFNNITSVTNYAFSGAGVDSDKDILDLSNLTSIGSYSFGNGCNMVKNAILNSVSSLSSYAFHQNSKIESANLELSSLNSLSEYAFSECTNLKYIILPDPFSGSIGSATFKDCSSMNHIYIPRTTSDIRGSSPMSKFGSFYGCKNLTIYTDMENRFDISNATISNQYNCHATKSNNIIIMYNDSNGGQHSVDVFTATLEGGQSYCFGCDSDASFKIVAVIDGVEQADSPTFGANMKGYGSFYISKSSKVTLRLYGDSSHYSGDIQRFGNIIFTTGYPDSAKNYKVLMNWDSWWNVYDITEENDFTYTYKGVNVKYGYTLDQYKSEVGID